MNFIKNFCSPYFTCCANSGRLADAFFKGFGPAWCTGVLVQPLMTAVHESTHAAFAMLLFSHANPKIKLRDYGFNGACGYNSSTLSPIGKKLGKPISEAIIAAAGPLMEMVTGIALARFYPCTATEGNALITTLRAADYALSAFRERAFYTGQELDIITGHDYVVVRVYGGLLPAIALIATSVGFTILSTVSLKYSIEEIC